jgi:hypothetical protein
MSVMIASAAPAPEPAEWSQADADYYISWHHTTVQSLATRHKPVEGYRKLVPENGPISVGSGVVYRGLSATVTKVGEGEDERIDLIYYEDGGRPRIAQNIPRGFGVGEWISSAQAANGRTLTAKELAELAVITGHALAPKIGRSVVFGLASDTGNKNDPKTGMTRTIPTRAVITGYTSLDVVDLDVYAPEPPADPYQPDEPTSRLQSVKRATLAGEDRNQVEQGCRGYWDFPGEDCLIKEFGPIKRWKIFPPHRCSRCKSGCPFAHKFFLVDPGTIPRKYAVTPSIDLCQGCHAEFMDIFLGGGVSI